MRQAAMARHAVLVCCAYGVATPLARQQMRAHADLVRAFYGF